MKKPQGRRDMKQDAAILAAMPEGTKARDEMDSYMAERVSELRRQMTYTRDNFGAALAGIFCAAFAYLALWLARYTASHTSWIAIVAVIGTIVVVFVALVLLAIGFDALQLAPRDAKGNRVTSQ